MEKGQWGFKEKIADLPEVPQTPICLATENGGAELFGAYFPETPAYDLLVSMLGNGLPSRPPRRSGTTTLLGILLACNELMDNLVDAYKFDEGTPTSAWREMVTANGGDEIAAEAVVRCGLLTYAMDLDRTRNLSSSATPAA